MDVKEIFSRQFKHVYTTAIMYMKNPDDAEDIAQDVFVKYIRKRIKFKDEAHEKAWFIKVTVNRCKDVLRSYYRKNVELGEIPEGIVNDNDNAVLHALMSLPEKYREVLYAYYYEGYSTKEISRLLKRNESTIRTQMSVGRERLKKYLEEEEK